MRFLYLLMVVFSLTLTGCQKKYPKLIAETATMQDGSTGLKGWKLAKIDRPTMSSKLVPEDRAFKGAVSWFEVVKTSDPKKAVRRAFKAQGMNPVYIVSVERANVENLRVIDPSPKATAHAVIAVGKRKGKPVTGTALVWYGKLGLPEGDKASSGVHAFIAPTPKFKALGGIGIPGVRWFGAVVNEDASMLEDGRLSPDKDAKNLVTLFDAWVINYYTNQMAITMMTGQLMAIQNQTLMNMQSYNNALSTCTGLDNCSIVMDGTGGWTADVN